MANTPAVSIIIPTYNGEQYIERSINSLLGQTFDDFEIVVIDDGSTDETVQTIHNSTTDPRVKVHEKEENSGFTSAMNTGILQAEGKYISFQGQDDYSIPTRLEKQTEILESNPAIELVHSPAKFTNSNGETIKTAFNDENPTGVKATFFELYKKGMYIAAPSIMMKKRHLSKLPVNHQWGRPHIKICSDYEHVLHIAHDYKILKMDEPIVEMLRGEDHEYASRNLSRNLKENLDVIDYIRDFYKNSPPIVNSTTYRRAVSNQYSKYGYSLMLQRRFKDGIKLLWKGIRHNPTNPYWYKKVLTGIRKAVEHYAK